MSDNLSFPQNFLWGAATSSHQVEGHNIFNDWWHWETSGKTNELSGAACDSYQRFEEDLDLAKGLNHNAHRFSIEWSRVEPEQGQWNKDALDHYKDVVKGMRFRGIEPVITLNHFTLPQWMSKKGGWENPSSPEWFEKFSSQVVTHLGQDVTYWITLNEANVLVYKGYVEGDWPPGKSSFVSAYQAHANLAKAHIRTYVMIHRLYERHHWKTPKVGLSHHFMRATPLNSRSFADRMAAAARKYFNNDYFIQKIYDKGRLMLDFVGVNYYFREIVKSTSILKGFISVIGEVTRDGVRSSEVERNDLEWEVNPHAFGYVVNEIHQRYGLPIMITENGICTRDEDQRERFIKNHLRELQSAIRRGVSVIGYMHWSLLDNFEWSIGYFPKFGLIGVNNKDFSRHVKPSARFYASICKNNALPKH